MYIIDCTHRVWGDRQKDFDVSDARLSPRWEALSLGHLGVRAIDIGDDGVDGMRTY
jgi:hypothetical protein